MGTLAPIILMAYKRPEMTKRALESLAANPEAAESELYVFADGPKESSTDADLAAIAATRSIIRSRDWCGTVHITEKVQNEGLAVSVIAAVTAVLAKHGRAIILEDDLVLSPYFLQYMNGALELYKDEEQVASIHGYVYPLPEQLPPTFFIRGADCWGWATWDRAWKQFEPDGKKLYDTLRLKGEGRAFNFDNNYDYMKMLRKQISGENDSWAIRWYAATFLKNMVTLYPAKSLVQNIGADGSGTHMNAGDAADFDVTLAAAPVLLKKIPVAPSEVATAAFVSYFGSIKSSLFGKIIKAIRKK
ncbi:glycosyltransferase [Chitinophaga nivalis]|uniref:Glycosyltransferase n=1 Tax=Chitinophaga nivalis TaxID=2991709 RepID=A0ABT3INT0_9BACT|nr:glycosyltransferase [Chitinophaga nivalis]MCW3464706.1 glycosyltransferase [Chitinophaga nivalis]MCW3485603.1 glycosyltransferase [Chitinophaga nivalis]